MNDHNFRIANVVLLGLLLMFTSCFLLEEEKKATPASTEVEAPLTPPPVVIDPVACGEIADGANFTQIRFQASQVFLGTGSCQSEEQTCQCSNGVVTCTGEFTELTCNEVLGTIESGDILLVAENGGPEDLEKSKTMRGSSVVAFSSTGTYKGVVLRRKVADEILRYPRGLRFDADPFESRYHLVYGTSNSSLGMEVHRALPAFIPGETLTLESSEKIPNTDSVASDIFIFGMTGQSKYGASRYVSDLSVIYRYVNGATATTCLDYSTLGDGHAGWKVGGLFFNNYGFGDVYVARYNGDNYAIDRVNSNCTSHTLDIITGSHATFGVRIMDIMYFRSATDPWDKSIFLSKIVSYAQTQVVRYSDHDENGTWDLDSTPFTDTTRAVGWDSTVLSPGRKLITMEDDGTNYYLRRYDASGNLEATLYTDVGQQVLYTGAGGVWIVVAPY